MKKIIVLLFAVLTAFSLSACKKDKVQTESLPTGASSDLDSVFDATQSDGVSSDGAQETASDGGVYTPSLGSAGDGSSDTPKSSRVSGSTSQVTVSDGSSLGEIEVVIPSVGDRADGAVTEPNGNGSSNGTGGGSPSGDGSLSGGDGGSSSGSSSDADQWTNGYY